MKRTGSRLLSFLLVAVMLTSLLPASAARRVTDELPAVPIGEEAVEFTAPEASPSAAGAAQLSAVGDLSIPGYTQVTALNQIKANRQYMIVSQAPDGTFYALYLNQAGTSGHSPGETAYPDCTATLTISGETVSAVSTADTSTSIAMSDLHVTIAESTSTSGSYTIKNSSYALRLNGTMYSTAASAPVLPLSFVSGNRFSVQGTGRYLTFNVKNATSEQTHFPSHPTGFCGWNDPQPQYIPIYLFIKGDLPVEPGINLTGMLSGDKIGGGATPDANPDGQNSWVFTGGRAAQGSFADVKGARTYAGHFEEYIRYTHAKQLQPSGESTTPYFQRHVINAAYEGQTLAQIVSSFDTRITPLKPRAVSYLVDEGGSSEANFATNLNSLITKALALQNNTGMLVIETLSAADKAAVDAVLEGRTEKENASILAVNFTLTAAQKTDGFPNASGHLAMAKQLADAVAGATVSSATNWPYGAISGSVMASGFPNKTSLDHAHGYINPTTLSAAQSAIKTKVQGSAPMTWLFMGDSITHGSAWTGGYDTLAQLFEKFVKDDLDRTQDIVINAGSSGATTASTINDLNRRLTKYSPDVVVLMLGTNDASAHVAEATYKANIRTILDAIIAKGATPVLRTPPPTTRSGYDIATYAQYIRDIVDESAYAGKVVLVDQYELWHDNDWSQVFTRDALHPDEAGHLWFTHQLIKELALWSDSYSVCRLEYVEMTELEPIVIPGYTQLTDMSQLDETKGYLIVSQDAEGTLYALYPSADGETLGAGSLPSPGGDAEGARAAKLTVSGETVSAVWMKDNSPQDMEKLLFTIKRSGSNYVFTAFNGRHLNMTDKMFTEGTAELTVTARGTAALYAFRIQNGRRSLDFSKTGDPDAFNGSQYGTDFWCPNDNIKMRTYLFASTVEVPTAKDGIEDLLADITKLTKTAYTGASWAALETAKAAAQAVLDAAGADDTGDEAKYVTARDNLRDAIDALSKKPTPPTVPSGATKIEDWKTMVPQSGTTQDQPFDIDTAGSHFFRIPAIITLRNQKGENADKNGRLLAAIDARWSQGGDACNLDTLTSYSDDGGANWKYAFANYFGDSTNAYAQYGTAFIDPQLVETKDGDVYLMVDIWPGGIALNTAPYRPASATGYVAIDGTQRLALYTDALNNSNNAVYDYYVGDFADGYAPVLEPIDGQADTFSGYYVDEYYYIYYTAGGDFAAKNPASDKIYCQRLGDSSQWVQQNVFFWNATLHVRNASYLWIVKSTDGGETWSKPQMINDQVRTDGDAQFYGVGPGAGLCVETNGEPGAIPDGTLLMPTYIWPDEHASFIYSTDGGESWERGPYATQHSASNDPRTSESNLIQLDEKTVRQFYRESWNTSRVTIAYTDHTWNGSGWVTGEVVRIPNAYHYGACEIAVIKYSKQIDGKDVILYSAPTAGSGRTAGAIHALLINNDENRTMELYNTLSLTAESDRYNYSSMTETPDGNIALLYEYRAGPDAVTLKTIPITDLIPDLSVTGYEGAYDGNAHNVTAVINPTGATLQYAVDGGSFSATAPSFTNVGEHTVTVKATWDSNNYEKWSKTGVIERTASADVVITQVQPTLSIETDAGTVLNAGEEYTYTISGVPSEGTVTLTCSNPDHPPIELTRQDDGTYTGAHEVAEGNYILTATYTDPNGNYANASATYNITVAPAGFDFTVKPYAGTYDGQSHSVAVTAGADITVTYCEEESGDYTAQLPTYTNAGTYTVYYKATKGEVTVTGSANVTIAKATPTLAILCGNEDHGETHSISTADLPFTLTITGVPAEDQGKFTLTTFNDAVRNLTRNADGTWTASPYIPRITRTYHFIATFDPTVDQAGNEIENPNYERATDEFTVTVSRPPDEVIDFNFHFTDEVAIDPSISTTKGTFEVIYDGAYHGPLPALTYDKNLVLTYHVSSEDAEIGTESWTSVEPTFRQPGEYTVSVMASPATSTVAKVLTVVLNIVEKDIPVTLELTPSATELNGGDTLELTVTGVPTTSGTITVTSQPSLTIRETARGQFSVTLPNTTGSYTFTADFSGAGSYQEAASNSVTVNVTAKASSATTRPTTTTTTGTREDGSTVTTVTDNRTGTVTETVEKPDGTVETVETKKDGTKTETVIDSDGTKAVTETKPDGSKTATVEQPDGTTSETVVTPEGDATITVTDPEGEELAKVEIPAEVPASDTTFVDTTDHWAKESIDKMAALKLVKGVGEDKYKPTDSMTRGSLATVLHRLSNGKTDYQSVFADVDNKEWYAAGVAWAAKADVVRGVSDDLFAPDQIITREQLATMLCRYAKLIGMNTKADAKSLESFVDDNAIGGWAVDSMAWCVENGILQGKGENNLDPTADVSRAEVAVMLDRFISLIK